MILNWFKERLAKVADKKKEKKKLSFDEIKKQLEETELESVKTLHEENIGLKLSEEDFARVLEMAQEEYPNIVEELIKFGDEYMGVLMTLDDFTSQMHNEKILEEPYEYLHHKHYAVRQQAAGHIMEHIKDSEDEIAIDEFLEQFRKEKNKTAKEYMFRNIIGHPQPFLNSDYVKVRSQVVDQLIIADKVDILVEHLKVEKDKKIIEDIQEYLMHNVEGGKNGSE